MRGILEELIEGIIEGDLQKRIHHGWIYLKLERSRVEANRLVEQIEYVPKKHVLVGDCYGCGCYVFRAHTHYEYNLRAAKHLLKHHRDRGIDRGLIDKEVVKEDY